MKKLLLILLLIPTSSWADSQTNGSLKLLLPTTGQAFTPGDPSKRPWGDKINANFRIIDASVTQIMNGGSNSAAFNTHNSTNDLQIEALKLQNSTSVAREDSFQNFRTTTDLALANGGASTLQIQESTKTMTFRVGTAIISTITACGFPTACHTWGPSTATITGIWADAYSGSTVGWTRVDLIISTGGINGLPLAPMRFDPLSISTALSQGLASYSGFVSTRVPISPGEWIGVAITSMAASGLVTQGIEVHVDYWEKSRY